MEINYKKTRVSVYLQGLVALMLCYLVAHLVRAEQGTNHD